MRAWAVRLGIGASSLHSGWHSGPVGERTAQPDPGPSCCLQNTIGSTVWGNSLHLTASLGRLSAAVKFATDGLKHQGQLHQTSEPSSRAFWLKDRALKARNSVRVLLLEISKGCLRHLSLLGRGLEPRVLADCPGPIALLPVWVLPRVCVIPKRRTRALERHGPGCEPCQLLGVEHCVNADLLAAHW